MSCSIAYKKISKDQVIIGYSCDSLEESFKEKDKLINSISDYCDETGKFMESKILITPFKDEFIIEIKVAK
jgi:hypothetical protein